MTIDGFVRFKNCVSSVYLDRRGVDIPRTHLDIINVTRETFRKRSILKKFVEKLCGYSIHREHVYIYIYQMQITCFPLFLYDRNFSSNSHSRQEEFPLCNRASFRIPAHEIGCRNRYRNGRERAKSRKRKDLNLEKILIWKRRICNEKIRRISYPIYATKP